MFPCVPGATGVALLPPICTPRALAAPSKSLSSAAKTASANASTPTAAPLVISANLVSAPSSPLIRSSPVINVLCIASLASVAASCSAPIVTLRLFSPAAPVPANGSYAAPARII